MGLYASDVARTAVVVAAEKLVAVAASLARNGAKLVAVVGSWLGEHTELLQVLLCLTAW